MEVPDRWRTQKDKPPTQPTLIRTLKKLSQAYSMNWSPARAGASTPPISSARSRSRPFSPGPSYGRPAARDTSSVKTAIWEAYTKSTLVFDQSHVVVRGKEADGKTHFVDIFTWVSRSTQDHPPTSVLAVWQSIEPLVEARNGHPSLEITEVQLIVPKN